MRVTHHIVGSHATHTLGIEDMAILIGFELGQWVDNFVLASVDRYFFPFLVRGEIDH